MKNQIECDETFETESAWDTIERMGETQDESISVNRGIYK